MNGLPHLAADELNTVTDSHARVFGPELLAGEHLLIMAYHLEQKEYARADEHVSRSLKAWPNNPVAVYLTGEQQLATGKFEEAANSFEKTAEGTDGEWFAERMAERAREVRDSKGAPEPLFRDPAFVRSLVLHYIWEAAKTSPPAAALKATVTRAKAFGAKLLDKLKPKSN
jgi:thioredoxin-like negative regulator of GroEL